MTLMAAAVTVSLTSILMPEGKVKKYAHLVSSVVISLSVIAPFKSVFNITEFFDYSEISYEEISYEDAENIYFDNLKKEVKNEIEKGLMHLGRIYATVENDLTVSSIEIYADKPVSLEDEENIRELYNPGKLEIIYGES